MLEQLYLDRWSILKNNDEQVAKNNKGLFRTIALFSRNSRRTGKPRLGFRIHPLWNKLKQSKLITWYIPPPFSILTFFHLNIHCTTSCFFNFEKRKNSNKDTCYFLNRTTSIITFSSSLGTSATTLLNGDAYAASVKSDKTEITLHIILFRH